MNITSPLACAPLLLGVLSEAGADWPQWRGPERTGSLPSSADPVDWPESLVEQWEREVGEGYSGPIVAGDRLWVHARQGGREIVSSLRLGDGEEVWSIGYEAEFEQDPTARDHGLGPYSTPAVADGRLFTLGVTSILSAWKADSGDLLWRKDYAEEFDPSYPIFGASASPLVWNDLCFVHFGSSDEQRRGEPGIGAMVALRVADGSEVWRWDDDGPALAASPVIHEIEGRPQLVFKTKKHIVGADPLEGTELWRIPFKVDMDNTIVTPVLLGNRLLTSDYQKGFNAWSIESEGGSWSADHRWRNRDSLFMSSPVSLEGVIVGFTQARRGRLFALDPDDGTTRWRGEPGWGEHASLIARGDEVLVFREDGSLIVGEVSREAFRALHTYRLGGPGMWGHPAVVEGRIIVRDGSRVVSFGLAGG